MARSREAWASRKDDVHNSGLIAIGLLGAVAGLLSLV
jgi:hypothetical protein